MAEPTMKQRMVWAKQGIAMPDGSYYIRNAVDLGKAIEAVGRATPNAGESDVARRNAVRRHIIKRANEMKMAGKIPDTWASDGSLKQPTATHQQLGEEILIHFGRKGMKWGEHVFGTEEERSAKKAAKVEQKRTTLLNQAKQHEQIAAAHKAVGDQVLKDTQELLVKGHESSLAKANPGANLGALHQGALAQSGAFHRSAARHTQVAQILRQQAADLKHSTAEDFIAHFGRKGMKWGEHVFGRNRGSGTAAVHPDVARARAAQATIRTHGLHALSNNELRDLNKRTQLETEYARLHVHTSEGKKIVQQIAKEQSKALATGYIQKYGPQGVSWLVKNGIKITVGHGRHKS